MRTQDRQARRRLGPEARTGAILAAATRAFTDSSYDRVSVSAVAGAADASEALVYRYFDSKAGLYTAVVRDRLERLAGRQAGAVAGLGPNSSARDLVRVSVEALLDHVQEHRAAWASPFFTGADEPAAVQELRQKYRQEFTAGLAERLDNPGHRRARLAITGFLGHLGATTQQWADDGCPASDRGPLVEAALGALQGGLGDWGSLRPPTP
ncbi:MAG: TetR/AcrR family transcriptional regulator [Propionibacteriaceae bacterium]|nr:TetR/AcrR family transcriptional regulator [Propionibacteriaceae bacterium]